MVQRVARLTGASAECVFQSRREFTNLRRLLELNTHFNGAMEMLERVEAALTLTTKLQFPVPTKLFQNPDSTIGLLFAHDFSLGLSTTSIVWRFARAGEPHAVHDAATKGVPQDVIDALAHLSRVSAAAESSSPHGMSFAR